MMWKALEVLSCLDWLGPWLRFLPTIGKKMRTFFVPFDGRWSGQSLHDLLEEYGVEMLAWEVLHGEQFFHVDADQADWAYQILIRHGVELL